MLPRKKLILFDVDDTLAPSKCEMSNEMADTLTRLLQHVHVGIISGGKWEVLKKNIVDRFPPHAKEYLHRFHVLPTCGARYLTYRDGEWREVYAHLIEESERKRIMKVLTEASLGEYVIEGIYGDIVEDRGTQVTFSMFGQHAPLHVKDEADRNQEIRKRIVTKVLPHMSDYEVKIGGATSIDVTQKGIDKGHGIQAIKEHLGIELGDIGFVGDAVYPGGNDYPAVELGIDVVAVKNPGDTLTHLISWLELEDKSN